MAHHGWDTAQRREEFASSLQAAVAAAPRNAPKARPNNTTARKAQLTKGSR